MSKRSSQPSRQRGRQSRQAQRQRQQLITRGVIGVVALLVVGGLVWAVVVSTRPPVGEAVPIMEDAELHVPTGEQVAYSTNPPTSGPHYSESARPGFYEEPVDDGYLVHSLEHGYVIVWYNCEGLSDEACADLKANVADVVNGPKLIGVPRSGMETPLALTSWGRLLRLERFDRSAVREFIRSNIGKAPEPQGE